MKTKQIEAYGVSAYTEQLYQGFKEGFKPDLETNEFAPVDIAGFFVCTLVSAEKAKAEEPKAEPEVPVVASKEQAELAAADALDTSESAEPEEQPEVPVKKTRKSKADKPTE